MADPKKKLVLLFLICGLLLFAASYFYSIRTTTESTSPLTLIGHAHQETGGVMVFRAGFLRREAVNPNQEIFNLDSIETNETGEATVFLENAYRLRIFEDSLITFEKMEDHKGSHILAIIKKGDLRVDTNGRPDELFISKNGERILASDYDASDLKSHNVDPKYSKPIPTPPHEKALSDEEITSILVSHRNSFYKCYTQLLQKNPHAKGNVTLAFTIETTGKISVLDADSSQLDSADFKKCLLDVLARVTFRAFIGPAITTYFPIRFE